MPTSGVLRFPGIRARRPVECVRLPDAAAHVASGGFWGVVGEFEGTVRAWRFAEVDRDPRPDAAPTPGPIASPAGPTPDPGDPPGPDDRSAPWRGPDPAAWTSSMSEPAYRAAVEDVRRRIRAGDVYQANLCRVLSAPFPAAGPPGPGPHPSAAAGPPGPARPSAAALATVLAAGNPAPFGGYLDVPAAAGLDPVWVVSASPELFLRISDGSITSAPIKGTAATPAGLTAKDRAENVMIADLVRNDLQRLCHPGTVEVLHLLDLEHHPGLVHLVTTVRGRLLAPAPLDWAAILTATFPPASVSGAPKLAALDTITALEPVARGPYCGAVGWIDSDRHRAELAVGIRTFWWDGTHLRFGTGAGITWGSDPAAEWAETELKAARLVALASTTADRGRRGSAAVDDGAPRSAGESPAVDERSAPSANGDRPCRREERESHE